MVTVMIFLNLYLKSEIFHSRADNTFGRRNLGYTSQFRLLKSDQ